MGDRHPDEEERDGLRRLGRVGGQPEVGPHLVEGRKHEVDGEGDERHRPGHEHDELALTDAACDLVLRDGHPALAIRPPNRGRVRIRVRGW